MKKNIGEEFNKIVCELTDDEFWEYVRGWFDEQFILDTMKNWDEETTKEAIKEIKNIINARKKDGGQKTRLTQKQTDTILNYLNKYGLGVVDMEDCPTWIEQPIVSEEYFNEKVNEALEDLENVERKKRKRK